MELTLINGIAAIVGAGADAVARQAEQRNNV